MYYAIRNGDELNFSMEGYSNEDDLIKALADAGADPEDYQIVDVKSGDL